MKEDDESYVYTSSFRLHPSLHSLEVAAASLMAAITINLYGVACTFAGRATEFAAISRRAAAGWVLTNFLVLIIRHSSLPPVNLNCRLFGAAP